MLVRLSQFVHSKCFELIIIVYIYVCSVHFVGIFEYLYKTPISIIMSNCLSICLCVSAQFPLDAFLWNLILGMLMKICLKKLKFH